MPKRLQVYPGPDVTVTFDPNLCTHAAECLRSLPAVFDVSRQRWIRPEAATAEEVAATVARCPTGALQAIRPGVAPARPVEPPVGSGVVVHVLSDGPALIKGPVTLELMDGERSQRSGQIAICRCGRTGSTPFCDGSHAAAGFRSPR